MTDVQFEDSQGEINRSFQSRRIFGEAVTPGMVRMLVKTGIVKTEKAASFVLFGVFIVAFLSAAFLYVWGGMKHGQELKLSPQTLNGPAGGGPQSIRQ